MHYLTSCRLLFIVPLALLLSACATSPTGRTQLMLVSEGEAISYSKQAYIETVAQLDQKGKLVTDTAVTGRVDRITRDLVRQAAIMRPASRDWDWEVRVIEDDEQVNAWCMAGGKMAVYTGLLKKLNPTDDELAQVMGHEISHALANHTAEKMSIAMATSLGIGVLSAATDRPELTAAAGAVAATLAIQMPNSRTAESEADRIGIELAAKAGYDPRAAVTLWEKMGKVGGASPPEFLSTHPHPAKRQATLRKLAEEMMPYYEQARAQRLRR
ncbi:MAG: M48 family metallopeptidase [Gammaproteobacteria bacterium]|nr:M48 family metallopeptidase [Gammaproteobacteria bacterium]